MGSESDVLQITPRSIIVWFMLDRRALQRTIVQYPPYIQSFNILHISLRQWKFAGRDEAIGPNLPYNGLHCFSLSGQIFYIEYEDDWPPPGCSRFLFLPRHKPNPLYYPWWQLQGTRHTCCHQHQLIIAQFSDSDTCAHKLKKMSRYCLPSWSHGTSTNGDLTKAQDPPGLKLAMSRISLDLSLISWSPVSRVVPRRKRCFFPIFDF